MSSRRKWNLSVTYAQTGFQWSDREPPIAQRLAGIGSVLFCDAVAKDGAVAAVRRHIKQRHRRSGSSFFLCAHAATRFDRPYAASPLARNCSRK
jgi:hypothetical protein